MRILNFEKKSQKRDFFLKNINFPFKEKIPLKTLYLEGFFQQACFFLNRHQMMSVTMTDVSIVDNTKQDSDLVITGFTLISRTTKSIAKKFAKHYANIVLSQQWRIHGSESDSLLKR